MATARCKAIPRAQSRCLEKEPQQLETPRSKSVSDNHPNAKTVSVLRLHSRLVQHFTLDIHCHRGGRAGIYLYRKTMFTSRRAEEAQWRRMRQCTSLSNRLQP